MIVHALRASMTGNKGITIVSTDTGIVVLAVANCQQEPIKLSYA